MTQVGDLDYLNQLYAASEDPWHLRSGWYYQRKRDVLLAALPRPRYSSTFQVGCELNELTIGLSRRSDAVLAVDSDPDLVRFVGDRLAHLSHVEVARMLPVDSWPRGGRLFDLIVLNEIGSRSDAAHWAQLCQAVAVGLAPDATVLACHYRHDLDGRKLQAETVHGILDSTLGLTRQSQVTDADFIIDVWTTAPRTVAQIDGVFARLGGSNRGGTHRNAGNSGADYPRAR